MKLFESITVVTPAPAVDGAALDVLTNTLLGTQGVSHRSNSCAKLLTFKNSKSTIKGLLTPWGRSRASRARYYARLWVCYQVEVGGEGGWWGDI